MKTFYSILSHVFLSLSLSFPLSLTICNKIGISWNVTGTERTMINVTIAKYSTSMRVIWSCYFSIPMILMKPHMTNRNSCEYFLDELSLFRLDIVTKCSYAKWFCANFGSSKWGSTAIDEEYLNTPYRGVFLNSFIEKYIFFLNLMCILIFLDQGVFLCYWK